MKARFAPSPTGYLHVGGARTALFSWLQARKAGGEFVLRIEDTDRERSTDESVQAILDGMSWLGLAYDEGPYYQTQRFDRYREVMQQLLDAGHAYYCYCSREELDAMRAEAEAKGDKPRYNGYWRDRSDTPPAGVTPVVRFRNPVEGDVVFTDLCRGEISTSNQELDDLIIWRSDDTPTYNFTVVIDDWDMGISHVIRGDDHINNTPRQINILQALNAPLPEYAHVPMILGSDGARLSKRHGAVSVMQYREEGFLPQALLNYLVRLGWSHGDQEVFSVNDMTELFEVTDCNRAPSTFNPEKLLWLNQQYLKILSPAELLPEVNYHADKLGLDTSVGPALMDVIPALQERSKTVIELCEGARLFYEDFGDFEPKAAQKNFKGQADDILARFEAVFTAMDDFNGEAAHQAILQLAEDMELKLGKVAQPLRVAVAGKAASPPMDATLGLLGKDKVLARIAKARAWMAAKEQ